MAVQSGFEYSNAAVWGLKLPDAVRKSKCYGGQPSDTTDERMDSTTEAHSPKKKIKHPEKTPNDLESNGAGNGNRTRIQGR